MKSFVILNPSAGGGAAGREWPRAAAQLREAIGPFELAMTGGRGEATALTRAAVETGYRRIVAVGGDGTINEAVNGLPIGTGTASDILFGCVTCGTGGDFRRSFGIGAGCDDSVRRLARGDARAIDVGQIWFEDDRGRPRRRLFVNIASFGLSGLTDRMINSRRGAKRMGGRLVFLGTSLAAFATYRFQPVRLGIDGKSIEAEINTVAVANGCYFGGGMRVAPDADPGDGMFDVVVMRGRAKLRMLRDLHHIYHGEHVRHPSVEVLRAREVIAEPLCGEPVLLDVDGEDPGRLPARFEILPAALRLIC
jgi:diacylglycerol kinase (ATP)